MVHISFWFYIDDVNISEGSIHTVLGKAEALVFASNETGLEVNVDKTKYIGHVSRSECRMKSQYKN